MNLYTIQYEVLHHTRIKTVLALTANDAYLIGKAQLEKEWGGESYLSRSTWRSQFLDVVTNVTPKTAATTAGGGRADGKY